MAKADVSLQAALVIVPAIAADQSIAAKFMKSEIEKQVRAWYAQGVSLQVDLETPLGKELKQKGWVK